MSTPDLSSQYNGASTNNVEIINNIAIMAAATLVLTATGITTATVGFLEHAPMPLLIGAGLISLASFSCFCTVKAACSIGSQSAQEAAPSTPAPEQPTGTRKDGGPSLHIH